MLRCAITDGTAKGFVNATQIERLRNQVRRWAGEGIDFIQLREKSVDAGTLHTLAEAAMQTLQAMRAPTKLLINARSDVAVAARAHGVHLTAGRDELTPQQVRSLFVHARLPSPIISVSCHTPTDIAGARHHAADFILFGPIFEKRIDGEIVANGVGLEALSLACAVAQPVPLLALGGVTSENTAACMAAGAAGIAGIRTFA